MAVYLQDYVILDEGHKIKHPTKTSKGVHMIAARHRIILTSTPIQNNLKVYLYQHCTMWDIIAPMNNEDLCDLNIFFVGHLHCLAALSSIYFD